MTSKNIKDITLESNLALLSHNLLSGIYRMLLNIKSYFETGQQNVQPNDFLYSIGIELHNLFNYGNDFGKKLQLDLLTIESMSKRSGSNLLMDFTRQTIGEIDFQSLVVDPTGDSTVGLGGFGTVFSATLDGMKVVVKILNRNFSSEMEEMKVFDEALMLCRHRHPNIVTALGYTKIPPGGRPGIVMERLEGSLSHLMKSPTAKLRMREYCQIFHGAARSLQWLHSHNVCHRDIKASNFLYNVVNGEYEVKLADFGLTMPESESPTRIEGSLPYMSPEAIGRALQDSSINTPLTVKSDVFSFGCFMYEMLCCKPMELGWNCNDSNGMASFASESAMYMPSLLSIEGKYPQLKDYIAKCWKHNPVDRPTMKQLAMDLEECRLPSLFDCPEAHKFWVESFGTRQGVVRCTEFFSKLDQHFQKLNIPIPAEWRQSLMYVLSSPPFIRIEKFASLVNLVGPIITIGWSKFLEEVHSLIHNRVFFGPLDGKTAHQLLRREPQSYCLRYNSKGVGATFSYSRLVYPSRDDSPIEVEHLLIDQDSNQSKRYYVTSSKEKFALRFNYLTEVIQCLIQLYSIKQPLSFFPYDSTISYYYV